MQPILAFRDVPEESSASSPRMISPPKMPAVLAPIDALLRAPLSLWFDAWAVLTNVNEASPATFARVLG